MSSAEPGGNFLLLPERFRVLALHIGAVSRSALHEFAIYTASAPVFNVILSAHYTSFSVSNSLLGGGLNTY